MFIQKPEYKNLILEINRLDREILNYKNNEDHLNQRIKSYEDNSLYQSNRIKKLKRQLHNATTYSNTANETIKNLKNKLEKQTKSTQQRTKLLFNAYDSFIEVKALVLLLKETKDTMTHNKIIELIISKLD